jgi:WD40 repeat protein
VIEVRQPAKKPEDNAEALLIGHSSTICALDVDPAGRFIVSGSWDAEARIWPVGKWECEAVLRGHEGSVWGVVAFDSETIITGCADKVTPFIILARSELTQRIEHSSLPYFRKAITDYSGPRRRQSDMQDS